jgi:hypothetical protein
MPAPGTFPMRYRVSEAGQSVLHAAQRDGIVRRRPPLVVGDEETPARHQPRPGGSAS